MATTTTAGITFTTLGELPEGFAGTVELHGVFSINGWTPVQVTKVRQNVGTRNLTEVHSPYMEDGFAYFNPAVRVRYID